MRKLVLFTSSYPYGIKETYLENEIQYLAAYYDEIEIFPLFYKDKDKTKREHPKNIKVNTPPIPASFALRFLWFVIGFFKIKNNLPLFKEFFRCKVFLSFDRYKRWLHTLIDYCVVHTSIQYREIKRKENSTFYFYWGVGWSFILSHLPKHMSNKYFVRLHGGEVYIERSNGYIPLRQEVFSQADVFLPISNQLKNYLVDNYKISRAKIIVSRLGTNFFSKNPKSKEDKIIRVVSVSNVIPLKRIDRIVDCLREISEINVEWVHFGDGSSMRKLILKCGKELPNNIHYTFKGRRSYKEIFDFYSKVPVDIFINVSKYEGVPVSIMEAMSFGIPCIATDAGATKELVNMENGMLLPNEFDNQQVSDIILKSKGKLWVGKRDISFKHWNRFYNAEINYGELLEELNK